MAITVKGAVTVKGGVTTSLPVVDNGLVMYLDAGSSDSYPGTGATWGDLINDYDGSISGATYSSSNGGVFLFDGTDDKVTTSLTENTFFQSSFTVSCWFKIDSVAASTFPRVFDKSSGSTSSAGFSMFLYNSSGNYVLYVRINGTLVAATTVTFTLNKWHHLTIVYSSSDIDVYLDGGSASTFGHSVSLSGITTTNPFTLGTLADVSRYFDGSIASVMIYNREITQTENTQNYNALKNRFL